jgi:AraC-like DNA-binding protein
MSLTPIKQRNTKNNILIDAKIDEINRLYQEGVSLTKISQQLGIHRKALTRLFKNNQVESRKGFSYARKYNLDEHYFDVINTEDKAYILGFIYADGNNLFSTNRIRIQLSKTDEEILQKMSYIFFGEEILKYSSRTNDKGKVFEYVALNLFSKHMSQHLATLGVVEAKSHKIVFPEWLDKSLYRHFIRGLIDGDGWIYLPNDNRDSPNVGLICTRKLNDFLKEYLEKELGLKSYLVKAHKQDFDVMCEIRVKNYHQCKIFLDWLYKDTTIFLQRKHNLYLDFLNRYDQLRDQNK